VLKIWLELNPKCSYKLVEACTVQNIVTWTTHYEDDCKYSYKMTCNADEKRLGRSQYKSSGPGGLEGDTGPDLVCTCLCLCR
jgi:hypothetical protein